MPDQVTTALAHVILAFSSGWSFREVNFGFASLGLFLYFTTGLIGAIVYGIQDSGLTVYRLYSNIWLLSLAFGLPSISSHLYATGNFSTEIVLLHFLPPVIFIACSPFYKRIQFSLLEKMQASYLFSVCYISYYYVNYYGFALVVSYAIAFFAIGTTGTVHNTPTKDLLSFSLAFSNFFTVKTIKATN